MKAPNVIVVLADQLNANWMGMTGNRQVFTPNLDHFAQGAIRFDSAYCQNPICTPSRVSFLSGQYAHNHGHYVLSGPSNFGMDNLFRHFRTHGHRTGGYGKLHLPLTPRQWVADDLDDFADAYDDRDGTVGKSEFLDGLARDGLRADEDSWHNPGGYSQWSITQDAAPSRLPYERTMERWAVDRALNFIDQPSDKPFFLQINFQKPHHPLLPQQEFWDLYPEVELPESFFHEPTHRPPHFRAEWERQRGRAWEYAQPGESFTDGARRAWRGTLACVTQIDDVFGRLLAGLEGRGLSENTIIVFSSDHGAYHGLHGLMEKAPGICSEEVCRIPLLIRAPGWQPGFSVSSGLVESVDLAPTLCTLAGLPAMPTSDGEDLTAICTTATAGKPVALTENAWSKAIRFGPWRYVHYPQGFFGDESGTGELYQIEDDPLETRNLFSDPGHAGVVAEARQRLLDRIITTTRIVGTHAQANPAPMPWGGCVLEMGGDRRGTNRHQPCFSTIQRINYL